MQALAVGSPVQMNVMSSVVVDSLTVETTNVEMLPMTSVSMMEHIVSLRAPSVLMVLILPKGKMETAAVDLTASTAWPFNWEHP